MSGKIINHYGVYAILACEHFENMKIVLELFDNPIIIYESELQSLMGKSEK